MKPVSLQQLAQWTNGRCINCNDAASIMIDAITIDTRTLSVENSAVLFVAIKGERVDGHALIAAASSQMAAAMVERPVDVGIAQLVVANNELALARIARKLQAERQQTVVAITGSNGKTSVKTLTHAVLAVLGTTYATPGNRNNEIGMPLAVIDAPETAKFAVYEMGTGKPGDIAYLTAIAQPDIALVNNVAPAHLERMGSMLAIADTKSAVYDDLKDNGIAIINADDAYAPYFAERAHGHTILRFGLNASADVTATAIELNASSSRFQLVTPQGSASVEIAFAGRHNVMNALAAVSIGLAAGATLQQIVQGLQQARPVQGRLITHALKQGAVLIDDSYNANPGSVNAAIDTLTITQSAETWLVLGDMRELGKDAEDLHAEVGHKAKRAGITRLFTLGVLSAQATNTFGQGAQHFESHEALSQALIKNLRTGVHVLVKGSRGSAMDKIVRAVLDADQATEQGVTHVA